LKKNRSSSSEFTSLQKRYIYVTQLQSHATIDSSLAVMDSALMNDSVAMELPTAMTDPMKKTAVIITIFR
jgi:hypothetical protein